MSTTEAANEIAARRGPVVYVDTCSIIDLIRGLRDKPKDNHNVVHAKAAMHIIKLAELKKLTIILPQQVLNEFRDNFADAREKALNSLKRLNEEKTYLLEIKKIYGAEVPGIPDVSLEQFAAICDKVVDRLRAVAVVSETTVAAKTKAADRTLRGQAPATTSKQSFKDCLVLESCYATLATARAMNFDASAFFLSSNVSEYYQHDSSPKLGELPKPGELPTLSGSQKSVTLRRLHSQLVDEFSALRLEAASNFGELRGKQSIKDL